MQGNAVKKIGLSLFLFICLLTNYKLVGAHEGSHPWLQPQVPDTYVVKKGDTLWGIACIFLRDPWRWKEIWQKNPDIQDPDLIYPGDRLSLTYVQGKPRLTLVRQKKSLLSQESAQQSRTGGVIKLRPKIRVLPADKAIPTIPLHVIEPFFNQSRVVTAEHAKYCPKIVALEEDHLVVGTGDHIYVNGLYPLAPETIFSIYRANKTYVHPISKQILGVEGLNLGKAQLIQSGQPARLKVLHSFAEIKVGDQIISTAEEKIDPFFSPQYPKGKPHGYIISVFDGLNQISQYQVLVITGGRNQQRQVGDVLGIYQTQKDLPPKLSSEKVERYQFPPVKVGRCVVFRVFDQVSYVLVMNATRAIYLLDEVAKP